MKLLKKYKSIIAYLFFGGLTTLINIVVYYLCYSICAIPNVPSTCIAWFVAVLTAYITNKLWVFNSPSFEWKVLWRETVSFFSCRILTGIMDVAIMYVSVDCLKLNSLVWKFISNVLVVVLNYLASRLIIFKKRS